HRSRPGEERCAARNLRGRRGGLRGTQPTLQALDGLLGGARLKQRPPERRIGPGRPLSMPQVVCELGCGTSMSDSSRVVPPAAKGPAESVDEERLVDAMSAAPGQLQGFLEQGDRLFETP